MILIPDYIFLRNGTIQNGFAIEVCDDGTIVSVFKIHDKNVKGEKLRGLLMPGLFNCHCHLELSWCKNLFPRQAGIEAFYGAMTGVHNRQPSPEKVQQAVADAISELVQTGVVAVADICNTDNTIKEKINGSLLFHNFIESFGTDEEQAETRFEKALHLLNDFRQNGQKATLSAHTLFTLSEKLMSLIRTETHTGPQSIHFLESIEESRFFSDKRPIKNIHSENERITLPFLSAADAAYQLLHPVARTMFVHNTCATANDMDVLLSHFSDPWFCLCPSSNLFITNRLPDAPMLFSKTSKILLGTDSLSSNQQLNLFCEMDILLEAFPMLSVENMLTAATINGAAFMNLTSTHGSFEPNKKPGVVLLGNYHPGIRELKSLPVTRLV